jgi:kinesin family protein 2/24
MRDDLRGLDPGNPNWEFFKMIRDYRAGLDFRPLQASDHVIDDRICVCVRKRPLSKKEKTQKEIEVSVS